jgi:hypothetical protein
MSALDHVSKLQHARFVGDPASIPPEFGTQPIPGGMVRINHYTRPEAIESIKATGLKQSANRDHVGDESFVFATAGRPGNDLLDNAPVVEGYADPERGGQLDIGENYLRRPAEEHVARLEQNKSTVTLRGDLPPSQILAVHEPWHQRARYMATADLDRPEDPDKPFASGSVRKAVARGEHDDLGDTPDYGPALKAVKIQNAATVMLGGKL